MDVGGEKALCCVKVLCGTFDLPAKAKICNFTQFNVRFGCTVCKEEGTVVKVGKGNARVYPCAKSLATLRNHKECLSLGKRALFLEEVI